MTGSSFCTMGGMHTMHQHQRMLQQSDDWPVILPNNTEHEDKMDNGGGQDHSDHDMNGHNNSNSHSHGMSMGGTTMYMDGFHWALFPSSQETPPPCLNLFHPSWTLHTQSKFLFAMAFVTILGMFVEACGVWRVKCLRKGRGHRRELQLKRWRRWEEQHRQDTEGQRVGESLRIPRGMRSAMSDISDVSSNEEAPPPAAANAAPSNRICPAIARRVWAIVPRCIRTPCTKICCFHHTKNDATLARRYDAAAAGLHAARAALGYLLMLAVMTYAVEFLLSAVAGMVLGRYWFVDRDGGDNPGGGVMNGAIGVGGGVGGMGLGEGGRQNSGPGVRMTDMQGGNDGTWGGADPCCGIDDADEDENEGNDHVEDSFRSGGSLHEPLLSPLLSNKVGVTRRSGVLLPEENPL